MKTFFFSLAGVIVIIILAGFIMGFIYWSRVPDMVAEHLTKKLQVAVQVGDMSLGMNKITVDKLQVSNPPQYRLLQNAFACDEIVVNAPLTGYLNKDIVIDEIDMNNVYIGFEFDSIKGASGNWTQIMKNVQKQSKKVPKSASERRVLIKRLVLNNIQADVAYDRNGGKVRHLPVIPQIVLTNISSKGGFPMDQITNSVLGKMLQSIFEQENIKNMLQNIFQAPSKLLSPFEGLFIVPQPIDDDALSA